MAGSDNKKHPLLGAVSIVSVYPASIDMYVYAQTILGWVNFPVCKNCFSCLYIKAWEDSYIHRGMGNEEIFKLQEK